MAAIVVLHVPTSEEYVLIGTGYGMYKYEVPGPIGGTVFPREESGEYPLAAVCGRDGAIRWFLTEELRVLWVDGKPVSDWLPARERGSAPNGVIFPVEMSEWHAGEEEPTESCPGCGEPVTPDARECPACGLALVVELPEEETGS